MKARIKQLTKFMFICRHKERYNAKLSNLLFNKLDKKYNIIYRPVLTLLDKDNKLYQYQQAVFYYNKKYSYLHRKLINLEGGKI